MLGILVAHGICSTIGKVLPAASVFHARTHGKQEMRG
jgi:hypothetical protein